MAPSPHPSSAFHKAACATSASSFHRRKLFSTCPWPAFPRACFCWDCFPPPSSPRGWALDHFRAQCPFPRQQTFSKAADPEAFSKAAGFLEQPAPFTNFTLALGAMALQKLSTLSTLACAAEPKHYKKKACMLHVNMYAKQDAFTLLQNSWIFCRHCRRISNLGEKLYSKLQASGLKPFPRHQVRQPRPFPRLSATLFGIEPLPHGNCLCFCQVILFQGCFDLIYDLLKIRSPSSRHFHHQSKLFQAISGALQVGPLGILGDSLPQLDPWLSARVLTQQASSLPVSLD